MITRRALLSVIFLFLILNVKETLSNESDAPRILTKDGHLIFSVDTAKNISFKTTGLGRIQLNDVDLTTFMNQKSSGFQVLNTTLQHLITSVPHLKTRLIAIETKTNNLRPNADQVLSQQVTQITQLKSQIRRLRVRLYRLKTVTQTLTSDVNVLKTTVNTMQTNLQTDNCQRNPCVNGGTCISMYDSFHCQCPPQWTGDRCGTDVNECILYAGLPNGCQNGAQCRNTNGGFECICANNFHGVLCDQRSNNCGHASHAQICGHGTCIPQGGSGESHICKCDNGWSIDSVTQTCIINVNECEVGRHPCSENPLVDCIDIPGSFRCGSCPRGYTGNGYNCRDVNECLSPNVCPVGQFCNNTIGSFVCSCPQGTTNRGGRCISINPCSENNGDCDSRATCRMDTTTIDGRVCVCPSGYVGSGIGSDGCVVDTAEHVSYQNCVTRRLCNNGTCHSVPNSYYCTCHVGYTGPNCTVIIDQCASQPCRNGGQCRNLVGFYQCICASNFYGHQCEVEMPVCGANIAHTAEGNIGFYFNTSHSSTSNYRYPCRWTIIGTENKIIRLTFPLIQLRQPCEHEYINIYEMVENQRFLLKKICSNTPTATVINSTRSSVTIEATMMNSNLLNKGFIAHYRVMNSPIERSNCCICWPYAGHTTDQSSGVFKSPGFPVVYPLSFDCEMTMKRPPGAQWRVRLTYASILIGNGHPEETNCSISDALYVRFSDGLVRRFDRCTPYTQTMDISSGFSVTFISDSIRLPGEHGFSLSWSLHDEIEPCGGLVPWTPNFLRLDIPATSSADYIDCNWVVTNLDPKPYEEMNISIASPLTSCVDLYIKLISPDATNLCGDFLQSVFDHHTISPIFNLVFTKKRDSAQPLPANSLQLNKVCHQLISINPYLPTTRENIITSPNYPGLYDSNANCVFEVSIQSGFLQSPESKIVMEVVEFDIADTGLCENDYLMLDGSKFCNGSPPPFAISRQSFQLIFRSNSSVSGAGFRLKFTYFVCGGIIHSGSQNRISFPEAGGNYAENHACEWILNSPENTTLQIRFTSFHLEKSDDCIYDYVEVFDFETSVGKYCGIHIPHFIILTHNRGKIKFRSDSSVQRDGFTAGIFHTSVKNCHQVINAESGEISAIEANEKIRPSYCLYSISVPVNKVIVFTVQILNISTSPYFNLYKCFLRDTIVVYLGATRSTESRRFCSSHSLQNETEVQTPYNQALISIIRLFYNDGFFNFSLSWYSKVSQCGAEITSSYTTVTSPNYPHLNTHPAPCIWKFKTIPGSDVKLSFINLKLFTPYYRIMCRNGYPPVIQVYYLNQLHEPNILFNLTCNEERRNLIKVLNNYQQDHFYLRYVSLSPSKFKMSISNRCKVVIRNTIRGHISNPNYPNMTRSFCSWKVQAPRGNKIRVRMANFNFPPRIGNSSCESYLKISGIKNEIGRSDFCGIEGLSINFTTKSTLEVQMLKDHRQAVMNLYPGFILEYAIEGCMHHLTTDNGVITSPNFPNSYPHNLTCIWEIEAPLGQAINITIVELDLEVTPDCRYDKLAIYDGYDPSDSLNPTRKNLVKDSFMSLVKKPFVVCNQIQPNEKPYTLISHFNLVRITFDADVDTAMKGFKLMYSFVNQTCNKTMHLPSGEFSSPNYSDNYENNMDCFYDIETRPGTRAIVKFDDINIESPCHDYIMLEGNSFRTSQIICNYTSYINQTFSMDNNKLQLRFHTDSSQTARGFHASFIEGCGGSIRVTDAYQVLQTPHYPYRYRKPCEWILTTANSDERISIAFVDVEIKHYYLPSVNCTNITGRLLVFDGENNPTPTVTYCGDDHRPPFFSTTNFVKIRFEPTRYGTSKLKLLYGEASTACGGDFYGTKSGILTNPNYPAAVTTQMSCIYKITSSPGTSIDISFDYFSVGSDVTCTHDYLQIIQGTELGANPGIRFCNPNGPRSITVNDNVIIRFFSSNLGNNKFMIEYTKRFGNNFENQTEGVITSPDYPHNYYNNLDVVWTISAPVNYSISLSVTYLAVEGIFRGRCHDKVEIYAGSQDSNTPLVTMCNTVIPDIPDIEGGLATIRFITDSSVTLKGFEIKWKINTPPSDSTFYPCNSDIFLTDRPVFITSPNYPANYPGNVNCYWNIRLPRSRYAQVDLLDMNIEEGRSRDSENKCPHDALTINRIKFCREANGTSQRISISRYTKAFRITFKTDRYDDFRGFKLRLKLSCSHFIRLGRPMPTSMFVTSQGYPEPYDMADTCYYVVKVPRQRTINFTVHDGQLASAPDGQCGSIMKISERTRLTTRIYCGSNITNAQYTSQFNFFVVTFMPNNFTSPTSSFKLGFDITHLHCGGSIILSANRRSDRFVTPRDIHGIECLWTITSPRGTSIRLDFDEGFHMENPVRNGTCLYDGVAVYSGINTASPLLGQFCGSRKRPPSVHSIDHTMLVHFYTDHTRYSNGFSATVSIASCGGVYTESSGSFVKTASTQYDSDSCVWNIEGLRGHYVSLTIQSIYISNCSAINLNIYNYLYQNQDVMLLSDACRLQNNTVITSPTNNLRINLTMSTSTMVAYRMTYRIIKTDCDFLLTDPIGVFSTLNYPNTTNLVGCSWKFVGLPGSRVSITITEMDIPRSCIILTQGTPPITVPKDTICSSASQKVIKSSGNTMMIEFSRVSQFFRGRGFKGTYDLTEPADCGGIITIPSTQFNFSNSISSPNYTPNHNTTYPNRTLCEWNIVKSGDLESTLHLKFNYLNVERHPICKFDYVRINFYYLVDNIEVEEKVGDFCGDNIPSVARNGFITAAHRIQIFFVSDHSSEHHGFQMVYYQHDCGGVRTLASALSFITSPGYPNAYPDNINCSWVLLAPQGYQVQVRIDDLEIEYQINCGWDYLSFFNGYTQKAPHVSLICQSDSVANSSISVHNRTITSGGNSARLEFKTDESVHHRGFKLRYRFLPEGSICGGTFHEPNVYFNTPNYPHFYPATVNCRWILVGETGYNIVLKIASPFGVTPSQTSPLKCDGDALIVNTNPDMNVPNVFGLMMNPGLDTDVVQRYCGNDASSLPAIVSQGNKMFVDFSAENSRRPLDGVNFTWTQDCNTTISSQRSTIFSPKFPDSYSTGHFCIYRIKPKRNYVVIVSLQSFNLRQSDNCDVDYLKINGRKYCGSTFPPEIASQRWLILEFKSGKQRIFHRLQPYGFQFKVEYVNCGGNIVMNGSSMSEYIHGPDLHPFQSSPYHIYSLNCEWKFETTTNRIFFVVLKLFSNNGVENSYYITTVSVSNTTDSYLTRLNAPATQSFWTTGPYFTVKLTSNLYSSNVSFVGFILSTPSKASGCGGDINLNTGGNGIIRSLDADNDGLYDNNQFCQWVLRAPAGQAIRIQFARAVVLEASPKCNYDYLQFRDGASSDSPIIGTFCNNQTIEPITTKSNALFIEFKSDRDTNKAGFEFNYTTVHSFNHRYIFVNHSIEQSGVLLPDTLNGEYRIDLESPSKLKRILVKVYNLTLRRSDNRCLNDHFQISDVSSRIPSARTVRLCNQAENMLPFYFESVSNHVIMIIRNASPFRYRFRVELETCNTTFEASSGRLYSPNFILNGRYNSDTFCNSTVIAGPGQFIQFYFRNFSLEADSQRCGFDSLQFFIGTNISQKLCGVNWLPNSMVSNASTHLVFKSDVSSEHYGYDITYVISDTICGGNIFVELGVITSPYYGENWMPDVDCSWIIMSPVSAPIEFQLTDLDLGVANSSNTLTVSATSQTYLQVTSLDSVDQIQTQIGKVYTELSGRIRVDFRGKGTIGRGFRLLWNIGAAIVPEPAPLSSNNWNV